MPNAAGATPATAWINGWASPPVSGAGLPGGTNGVRFAPRMKKAPATITNTQIDTLMITRAPVTRADSLTPRTAITVSTTTIAAAPRLNVDPSPNSDVGR